MLLTLGTIDLQNLEYLVFQAAGRLTIPLAVCGNLRADRNFIIQNCLHSCVYLVSNFVRNPYFDVLTSSRRNMKWADCEVMRLLDVFNWREAPARSRRVQPTAPCKEDIDGRHAAWNQFSCDDDGAKITYIILHKNAEYRILCIYAWPAFRAYVLLA